MYTLCTNVYIVYIVYIVFIVNIVYIVYTVYIVYNVYVIHHVYNVYNVYSVHYVYNVYNIHNVYNIIITLTKIKAFCTVRTPFGIVFDALFNRGYHQIQPLQNICFYKYGHNSGQKCIPRDDSDSIRRAISQDKQ